MVTNLGHGVVLAIDCAQPVAGMCSIVMGWIAWPASFPAPEMDLRIGDTRLGRHYFSLHDRPDVALAASAALTVRGFVFVASLPLEAEAPRSIVLDTAFGPLACALPAEGIGPAAEEALSATDWSTLFGVLHAAGREPGLAPLLSPDFGAFGIFTQWVERLPLLRPNVEGFMGLGKIDAASSPAGDAVMSVGLGAQPASGLGLRVIALVPRDGPAGGMGRVVPVALEGPPVHAGPQHLLAYGRAARDLPLPAAPFDLLAEVFAGQARAWFRIAPRRMAVPNFLEALHGLHGQSGNASLMEAHGWLSAVLEEREAQFVERLAELTAPPPAAPALATVAVIHGIADPLAARLIQLAAREIEERCAEVVLLGPQARAVAEMFLERGRIPARMDFDLTALVRLGTYAECDLVLLDPVRFAEALVAGRLDTLFARRVHGRSLTALSGLAALAGGTDASDMVGRLARIIIAREEGREARLRFGRADGVLGQMVSDHLGRLWRRAIPHLLPSEAA